MTTHPVKPITGKHVFLLIAGFFAVVIGVNAVMATLALSTFNGMTNENAYVDGLNYNETLAAIEAQQARDWKVDTEIRRPGGRRVEVIARYADQSGSPINQLTVFAEFVRPVSQGSDFKVPLTATGSGYYQGNTDVPLLGQWTVHIVAEQVGQAPYVLTHRTVVQ